jgi:hypothetical protein
MVLIVGRFVTTCASLRVYWSSRENRLTLIELSLVDKMQWRSQAEIDCFYIITNRLFLQTINSEKLT